MSTKNADQLAAVLALLAKALKLVATTPKGRQLLDAVEHKSGVTPKTTRR